MKPNKLILLVVGLINLFPLIGVISASQINQLYGIQIDSPDLVVLMRHRAILFGLLGAFIIYSAFRQSLQSVACIAGLLSMMAFVLLAFASGNVNAELNKVALIDAVASIALLSVLIARHRKAAL